MNNIDLAKPHIKFQGNDTGLVFKRTFNQLLYGRTVHFVHGKRLTDGNVLGISHSADFCVC